MWLQGFGVVVLAVCFASIVVWTMQRYGAELQSDDETGVSTSLFEVITVLYAIVLAFVLITSWEDWNHARHTTYDEADSLVEVYWSAYTFPTEQSDEVRETVRAYTDEVINEEWEAMSEQDDVTNRGWLLIDQMRDPIAAYAEEEGEAEQARIEDFQSQLRSVSEARMQRLDQSVRGLTGAMWTLLIIGLFLVVAVLLALKPPSHRYQYFMVSAVSAMMALLVFGIYQLELPFTRGVSISAEPYETAVVRFDAIDRELSGD